MNHAQRVAEAAERRLTFEALQAKYTKARGVFIEALKSRDENQIRQADTSATRAFNLSQKAHDAILGVRPYVYTGI
jgi:hypothetical protein